MRTRGLATVQDLSARGLLIWGPDGPQLQVPREVAPAVRQDRRTIDAVLRRAGAFARQLAIPSVDPFVRLRAPKWTQEGCPACGGPMGRSELRCDLCSVAVMLALAVAP
jgi:hypothetical protein